MAVGALTLAAPAIAQAQTSAKPTVTTSGATKLAPTTATLLGRVTPNRAETTYLFQYGTTPLYGATTPVGNAGNGTSAVPVITDLTGLAPATTYHFRLVAHNRNGTVNGADKVFRTRAEPLGLVLAATPNPVPFGRPTVLSGTLSGTGNAGRQILLQSNPFPYTAGFQPTANVQLTNATGGFAFPLLSVPLNTQYRVVVPDRPQVASPIVGVGVAVRVATNTSATRVRTGRNVRFFGTVRPARAGAQFAIQLLRKGAWRTVAGGTVRGSSGGVSRYAKRIRIRRGGQYRVFVAIADGNFVSSAGRTVRITRIF
ncbi:MAG TPA: hypothetical protein VNA28_16145 [Solirubrobacteraceae bacterium]|nr:hypothetical protein [Solirubrobacteraceae bacterium]